VIIPAAVSLFLYLAFALSEKSLGASSMAIISVLTFMVIMIFWGARSVSDSMMDEINQHTWDFQRMSAMGAWSMTWGKLVGSSLYPWFPASIALCVYIVSAWQLVPAVFLVKTSIILFAIAIFSLGFSLLNTLFILRKTNKSSSRQTNSINLVLGIYLLAVMYPLLNNFTSRNQEWYGEMYSFIDFALYTSLVFTAWVIIAVYRLMRQELQYQNSPLVWLIFIGFQLVYWSGFNFVYNANPTLAILFMSLILTWFGLYFSDNHLTTLRRFTLSVSNKQWLSAWRYTPLWCVSYVIFFASAVTFITYNTQTNAVVFAMSCLFFMLRDISIVLFFNINKRHGKTDSSALIITLILYLLLPPILQLMNAESLLFMFIPGEIIDAPSQNWAHILPALLQALIMWILVIRSYRKQWQIAH
ncbi:MAG: hypothetical protein HOM11_10360, partial [Methylococcales bacterium]|nr:hypothetical protein [Methylococcales bacterium]